MGCSVKVELPSHWVNTNLLGMVVCAVVGVGKIRVSFPQINKCYYSYE